MSDYYRRGFDDGYGRGNRDPFDPPTNDGEKYDYEKGRDDGRRRRDISRELDRDYFRDERR